MYWVSSRLLLNESQSISTGTLKPSVELICVTNAGSSVFFLSAAQRFSANPMLAPFDVRNETQRASRRFNQEWRWSRPLPLRRMASVLVVVRGIAGGGRVLEVRRQHVVEVTAIDAGTAVRTAVARVVAEREQRVLILAAARKKTLDQIGRDHG